jgi:hypothetical protein
MSGFFDTSGLDATADFGSSNNVAKDAARHGIADSSGIFDRLFGGSKSGKITSASLPDITPAGPPQPAISSGQSLVQRIVKASAPKPQPSANFDVPADARRPVQPWQGEGDTSGPPMPPPAPQAAPGARPGLAPGFPFSPAQMASPQGPMGMHNMPPPSSPAGPDFLERLAQNVASLFGPQASAASAAPRFPGPPNPNDLPPLPRPGVPTPPYPMRLMDTFQNEVNPFTRQQNMLGLGARPGYFAQGGPIGMARGGFPDLMLGLPERSFDRGGRYVEPDGQGDGRSDHVPAVLSPGEFVMDAETVALLGNGDNASGARRLEEMRKEIRKDKGRSLAKGKFSADAKKPKQYLKGKK